MGGEPCSKCMEYHGITSCRPLPPETTNKAWRKLHHLVGERHCFVNALGVLCEHILSTRGFNTQTVAVGPRARIQRTLTSDSHFRGTGALLPFMARSEAEYSMVTDVDVAQRMDVATPNPFELMRWLDLKIQRVGAVGVGCMYMSEFLLWLAAFNLHFHHFQHVEVQFLHSVRRTYCKCFPCCRSFPSSSLHLPMSQLDKSPGFLEQWRKSTCLMPSRDSKIRSFGAHVSERSLTSWQKGKAHRFGRSWMNC